MACKGRFKSSLADRLSLVHTYLTSRIFSPLGKVSYLSLAMSTACACCAPPQATSASAPLSASLLLALVQVRLWSDVEHSPLCCDAAALRAQGNVVWVLGLPLTIALCLEIEAFRWSVFMSSKLRRVYQNLNNRGADTQANQALLPRKPTLWCKNFYYMYMFTYFSLPENWNGLTDMMSTHQARELVMVHRTGPAPNNERLVLSWGYCNHATKARESSICWAQAAWAAWGVRQEEGAPGQAVADK